MAKKKYNFIFAGIYIILIFYLLYTLYPIYFMVITALKENKEIMSNPAGLPINPTVQGFVTLFSRENFGTFFVNSMFVAVTANILIMVLSIPLSYALARYSGKTPRFLYLLLLVGMMIPLRLGLLPLNGLLYSIGLIDSLWGIILIYVAMNIPFTMFILTGFIQMIPVSLEESAFIDGANTWKILWKIIFPLLKAGAATTLVYNFVPIWNDIFFPLIFIKSKQKMMFTHAVTMFIGQFSANWNMIFSALTIACIPVIVIYVFCSKYLVRGLMAGSIKG